MNGTSSPMDIDDPTFSRWLYATSDARSEALPTYRTRRATPTRQTPQPAPSPPPFSMPPSPVQTSLGVWEHDDGVCYSPNWPPVQKYLDLIRKKRRMVPAPNEIIFALAALDVVHTPGDVAHWIFWPSATYYHTADRVSAIALSRPRLIKTKIPWNGSREYKWILNAIQEKFYFIHVLGRWYPVDYQPLETKKRALRSNAPGGEDRPELTINQFFNIVEDDGPLHKKRKPTKKVGETQPSPPERRPRRAQQHNTLPTPAVPASVAGCSTNVQPAIDDAAEPIPRSSGRIKRKVSPSTRAPRVLTAITTINPIPDAEQTSPTTSTISELSSSPSHLRNRSISQASDETVVEAVADQRRSASVDSSKTAVGSSPSKKRKAELLEEDSVEDQQPGSHSAKRMTTRGRSSKSIRLSETGEDSEKGQKLPEISSPTLESRPKSTRPKTKTRKARA